MDEFAQSRGDDDLFDDEIIPIEQPPSPVKEATQNLERISLDPTPAPSSHQPALNASAPAQPQVLSSQPSPRGRGRGRGFPRGSIRGGGQRQQAAYAEKSHGSSLNDSKWSTKASAPPKKQDNLPSQPANKSDESQPPSEPITTTEPSKSEPPSEPPSTQEPASSNPTTAIPTADPISPPASPPTDAPTAPATKPRTLAVRGDRSLTGGFAKPNLTEEQLTAKLAAAKQRSQNLAEAHARAQADADEFAERERQAGERRRKEEGDSRKLAGEREKNRARKMGAMEGREWDRGKEEVRDKPRMQVAAGGQEVDLREYEWHEDRGRGRGRGRGGRGGGGGRGRGGLMNGNRQGQPNVSAAEEFPELPGAKAAAKAAGGGGGGGADRKAAIKPARPVRNDSEKKAEGKSWAEQMDE